MSGGTQAFNVPNYVSETITIKKGTIQNETQYRYLKPIASWLNNKHVQVRFNILPHPLYRLVGTTLERDIELDLITALNGGHYGVRLINNSPLTFNLPRPVQPGMTFEFLGRGIPAKDGGPGSALKLTFWVKLPELSSGTIAEISKAIQNG